MHSSTSNSKTRTPDGPHVKMLATTLCVFLLICLGMDFCLRAFGFSPNVTDNHLFWSTHREDVYRPNTLVILGSSRAQMGIDPSVIQSRFPDYHVVNLPIAALNPLEVLKDLCRDPNFKGRIIMESLACDLTDPTYSQNQETPHLDFYYDSYPQTTISQKINVRLTSALQENLAFLSPDLSVRSIIRSRGLLKRKGGMNYERFRPCDFAEMTNGETKKTSRVKSLDAQSFEANIEEHLRRYYERLKKRGGELVLVRMPTSGGHWAYHNKLTPKQVFWDQIEDWSGIPTVHFKDHASLQFDCPDGSHLDASDTKRFTTALSRIIKETLDAEDLRAAAK